uniref:Uncharacterized protein n=1 Tax=Aegilops tauschii subsp. strangulata TaxID=200361 RepID=A0A453CD52_AEGTS
RPNLQISRRLRNEQPALAAPLPSRVPTEAVGTMSMFPGMDLTKMDAPTLTLLGAACCVMLSMHFTVQLVSQHLFYWKNAKEQKAILIIVLMPPLYAITSFVGLLDIKGSKAFFTCLESVKECYEALVIAKFLALMYSYLNISISKNIVPDEIKGRVLHHSFPVSLFLVSTYTLLYSYRKFDECCCNLLLNFGNASCTMNDKLVRGS